MINLAVVEEESITRNGVDIDIHPECHVILITKILNNMVFIATCQTFFFFKFGRDFFFKFRIKGSAHKVLYITVYLDITYISSCGMS